LRELLVHYNNDVTKPWRLTTLDLSALSNIRLPPYPETVAYVARIIRDLNRKKLSPPRPLPVPAIQKLEHPRFKATRRRRPPRRRECRFLDSGPAGQFPPYYLSRVECPLLRTAVLHFFHPQTGINDSRPCESNKSYFCDSWQNSLRHVSASLPSQTYSPSATWRRKTLMYSGVKLPIAIVCREESMKVSTLRQQFCPLQGSPVGGSEEEYCPCFWQVW